jgi:hypothetical protein
VAGHGQREGRLRLEDDETAGHLDAVILLAQVRPDPRSNDVAQRRALPMPERELLVGLAEREQPAFERVAQLLRGALVAGGLPEQRLDDGQGVLGPMVQLIDQQLLALLRLPPFRDVLNDTYAVEKSVLRVSHARRLHGDPADLAVLPDVALLDRVAVDLAPDLPEERIPVRLLVFGMRPVKQPAAQQGMAGLPRDVADRLVDAQETTFAVDLRDADGGMLIGCGEPLLLLAQMLLALPKRLVDQLALGHVPDAVDGSDNAPPCVAQWIDVDDGRDPPAVRPHHRVLLLTHLAAAFERRHQRHFAIRQKATAGTVKLTFSDKFLMSRVRFGHSAPDFHGCLIVTNDPTQMIVDANRHREMLEHISNGSENLFQARRFELEPHASVIGIGHEPARILQGCNTPSCNDLHPSAAAFFGAAPTAGIGIHLPANARSRVEPAASINRRMFHAPAASNRRAVCQTAVAPCAAPQSRPRS